MTPRTGECTLVPLPRDDVRAATPAAPTADSTAVLYPDLGRDYPVAAAALGSRIYDDSGRDYVDGCSGALVVNLGHGVEEITDAIRQQLDRITFSYRTQFSNAPAEELAAELTAMAPGDLGHAFFTNSGSEAIEAALRLALQYWQERGRPERTVMIGRDGSYHGATLGAIALSGHPARRRPVAAVLPDWPRASAANCHACPFGLRPDSCGLRCAASVEEQILAAGPDRVAAVILEPVVGASGGAVPAPAGYLAEVAAICRRHDVLLIADEVISGLGRTGRWFGSEEGDLRPDLLVLGKGLSAGYAPLGAVLVGDAIHDAIRQGTGIFPLGHTYAANPLAAAVGRAVLRYAREHDLAARAEQVGAALRPRLRELLDDRGVTADVRGRGLLIGIEFTGPGGVPDGTGPTAPELVAAAHRRGLILYPAGTDAVQRTVLVAPPLTIEPADVDALLRRFGRALDDTIAAAAGDRPEGGASR